MYDALVVFCFRCITREKILQSVTKTQEVVMFKPEKTWKHVQVSNGHAYRYVCNSYGKEIEMHRIVGMNLYQHNKSSSNFRYSIDSIVKNWITW